MGPPESEWRQVILITGAGTGIGLFIAERIAIYVNTNIAIPPKKYPSFGKRI
ncbi:MAG: hypothetical protein JSW61_03510 [Candidatus Thorarchaeota archaeon]|nr:MAG: hypothetical protein JSW61_03510 [Candidatus Thorarchaeota archaeon]